MSKYNFEKEIFATAAPSPNPAEEGSIEKVNPNLSIIRCCGNCKYFYYTKGKERRGYCQITDTSTEPYINRPDVLEERKKIWLKRHVTNYCDNHKFRSRMNSIRRVVYWTRIEFDDLGKRTYDELSPDSQFT